MKITKSKIIWTPEQYKKRVDYNAKYNKHNTVTVLVRLNKRTESDLIEFLDKIKAQGGSKSGFLKMAAKCYIFENLKKNS